MSRRGSKYQRLRFFYRLLIVFLFWLLVGCGRESRSIKEIRMMVGKTITFEGDYSYFDKSDSYSQLYDKPIRIVTYIDNEACAECALKPLIVFDTIVSRVSKSADSIEVVAIMHGINIAIYQTELQNLNVNSVICVDSSHTFLKRNKLDKTLYRNRTFIIDANNRIVFVGDPVFNPLLQKSYEKILGLLVKHNGVIPSGLKI